jgi:hypothetical protein
LRLPSDQPADESIGEKAKKVLHAAEPIRQGEFLYLLTTEHGPSTTNLTLANFNARYPYTADSL